MASTAAPAETKLSKVVYGDRYEKLPFNATILGSHLPFSDKFRVGDVFKYAVELQMEHGATYNGSSGAEATLNAAIVGLNRQASVSAYEMQMRTRITTRAFEEAVKAGPQAFDNATRQRLTSLQTAMEFRGEHSLLYGQLGLFQVESIDTGVITITDATWCPTLAIRLVGAILEAFDGPGQAASATAHDGDLTVTGVDLAAKTITVSGTSSSVVAEDWLSFKGARTATAFNEMCGLMKICRDTSGDPLGIDASDYPWFAPNVVSSVGRPTMLLMLQGMRKLVGRNTIASKRDDKMNATLWVASPTYEILNSDLMTSRRFDGSYNKSKGTTGVAAIEYYGQTGLTELSVHPLLRDGDALALGADNGFRVGACEAKFDTGPDGNNDIWEKVTDKNSYEARAHAIIAPALFAPGRTVSFGGITE